MRTERSTQPSTAVTLGAGLRRTRRASGPGHVIADVRQEMNDSEYQLLMERATSYLREKNRLCWSEWRLDDRSRFDWSQEAGTIVFSGPDGHVTADIQFIGSWSADTNTWMWAWHNESIAHHLKASVLDVKRYGEIHDLPELKEAMLDGPIEAAWDMTSLSCYILQSDMGYRAPDSTKDKFTFLSLSNFRKMVESGPRD